MSDTTVQHARYRRPEMVPDFAILIMILRLTLIVPHVASGSTSLGPNSHVHSGFLPQKTFSNRFVPRGNGSRMYGSTQASYQVSLLEPMSLAMLTSLPESKSFLQCQSPRTRPWTNLYLILAHTKHPKLYHSSPKQNCRTRLPPRPSTPSPRSAV